MNVKEGVFRPGLIRYWMNRAVTGKEGLSFDDDDDEAAVAGCSDTSSTTESTRERGTKIVTPLQPMF